MCYLLPSLSKGEDFSRELSMKTFVETVENADKNRQWFVVDAADKIVGRVASEVASVLRGKRNVRYTANVDTGDFVVVVNVDKIRFTRNKPATKKYYKHTGFIGNMKVTTAGEMLAKKPEELFTLAVKGMLPKSALGHRQITKLKVYKGPEHPHKAQQPKPLTF